MEMTDLKAAIDDYAKTAETGLEKLGDRIEKVETDAAEAKAVAEKKPAEAKAAPMGVDEAVTKFQNAVDAGETKLADFLNGKIDEAKAAVADLETKQKRPGAAGDAENKGAEVANQHKAAFFNKFLQKGDDVDLKAFEEKALSTATGGDGGYAVPTVVDSEIERQLKDLSPMRSIVKVKTIETSDYKRLVKTTGAGSGWVGEVGARANTTTPKLEEVAIVPGEIFANAAATQRSLDDMTFDGEAWLMEEVAEEFAAQEGSAIVNGNGVDKPKGFLAYTTDQNVDGARAFGTIQALKTGVAGGFAAAEPENILIDLVHSLKARYRQGARFVLNSSTIATVRKMKDGDGNFIWRAGLAEGRPDTILGYGVVEAEDMPDIAANSLSIAFGNFERAYTLVERMGTRVLRDPYTNKPYVNFYATRRVGGALVNDEPLKLLQFAL